VSGRALGDVADFYGGSSLPEGEEFSGQPGGYLLLRVSDLNLPRNSTYVTTGSRWTANRGPNSSTAPRNSLVIPKRGGAIGTNKKRILARDCILDPNLMAIRPHDDELDVRFLYHWFRTFDLLDITSGSAVPQLNKQDLRPLRLPLPSIDEQRRIASVLDRADELRAKRRQSIVLLEDLAQSIFHGMFGDLRADGSAWPLEPMSAHLAQGARNGLSPSNGGDVENLVLTLSAITGGFFDKNAVKMGTFKAYPPASKRVDHRDFFVCRGNGNLRLVGLGCFPEEDMPEIVFPDTVIAMRVDPDAVGREYLAHVWHTKPVRTQIEAGARTTNGTFKINQGVVESIQIPVPPIKVQEEFGQRIRSLKMAQEQQSRDLMVLDELFASLQFRAFSGEL